MVRAGFMRALVAMLVLIVAPSAARADDAVGVVVTGDHAMQPELMRHIEGWLKRHGHTPTGAALDDDARTTIVNCMTIDDPACARGVVEARSTSQQVVFARVEVTAPQHDLTFTAYWFVKGHPPLAEKRVCERCAPQSWRPVTDQMLASLHKSADELTHAEHKPPPAPPPTPTPVPQPTPLTPPGATRPEAGSYTLPLAMFGVGAAGLVASSWFFYWGSKGGPNEPYVYPDASGWAIGTAAIGVGAIIGGIVLWRNVKAAPVATVGAHGGYIGWTARW